MILSSAVYVVGTPGCVFDMLRRNYCRPDYSKMFGLDEAKGMLSRSFRDQEDERMLLDIQKFYSVVVEELPTNVVDLLLTGFGLDCFLEKGAARLASNMVLPGRHDKNQRVLCHPAKASEERMPKSVYLVILEHHHIVTNPCSVHNISQGARGPYHLVFVANPPRASKALHNVNMVASPLRLQNKECQSQYGLLPLSIIILSLTRVVSTIYHKSIDFVDKYMIGQTLLSIGSVLSNAFSAHMLKDVSLKRRSLYLTKANLLPRESDVSLKRRLKCVDQGKPFTSGVSKPAVRQPQCFGRGKPSSTGVSEPAVVIILGTSVPKKVTTAGSLTTEVEGFPPAKYSVRHFNDRSTSVCVVKA
ncbi:hypothetical protein LguiA_025967 [Lonicera macranthoides]